MVDQVGAVADLDEQVPRVGVEQVARDAGALGLPVEPGAERAVVDPVVEDLHVDSGVELDASDLVPVELALGRDVVDVVVLDGGEHRPEMADDAVLAAVEDRVATYDVRADVLPVPPDLPGGEHGLELVLVAGLVAAKGRVVVPGRRLLAERDRRALRVVDEVVLDDPALRPVGSDQARLVRGRGRPRCGGLGHLEPAHRDVVEVVLDGMEDRAAHVDLDELDRWVGALEVCPDRRRLVPDLGVPDVSCLVDVGDRLGELGPAVHGLGPDRRRGHCREVVYLVEAAPVEVHVAQVLALARRGMHEPVSGDLLGERVEAPEQGVGDDSPPDGPVLGGPLRDALRPQDGDPLPLGRLIGDAALVAQPAPRGLHPLAVLALVDADGVTRLRERGGGVDGAQRIVG